MEERRNDDLTAALGDDDHQHDRDEAIMSADDTGMVRNEVTIVRSEMNADDPFPAVDTR